MRTIIAIARGSKPLAYGIWITSQFVGQELWCTGSMRSVEVESVIRYFSKILRCYSQRSSNHLHIATDASAVGERPDLFAVVFFWPKGDGMAYEGPTVGFPQATYFLYFLSFVYFSRLRSLQRSAVVCRSAGLQTTAEIC